MKGKRKAPGRHGGAPGAVWRLRRVLCRNGVEELEPLLAILDAAHCRTDVLGRVVRVQCVDDRFVEIATALASDGIAHDVVIAAAECLDLSPRTVEPVGNRLQIGVGWRVVFSERGVHRSSYRAIPQREWLAYSSCQECARIALYFLHAAQCAGDGAHHSRP